MPMYEGNCPKKHKFQAFQSFSDYDENKPLLCPDHNIEGNRLISKPMVNGTSSFKLGSTGTITRELEHQLGRSDFRSAKEVDDYCKANNLTMVDKDWQPSNKILKDREAKSLEKMGEALKKELSQHSEVILPDGTRQPLGL